MLHNVEKIQIRPREKVTTEPTAPPKQENRHKLALLLPGDHFEVSGCIEGKQY